MALVNLTKDNFDENIQNTQIAILDFWAPWCGPCRSFAPIFESVAEEYPDILFGKINTEEEQELASHFQIQSIPTIVVIKEGIGIFAQPGMLPEDGLKELIEKVKEVDMDEIRTQVAAQEAAKNAQEG